MSERAAPPCPHDVGPGISVCLRCRKENRIATRERRRRILFAAAAIVLGIATIGAAGAAGMLDNELRAAGFIIAEHPGSATPAPVTAPAAVPAAELTPLAVAYAPSESTMVSEASVTIPRAPELAATIGEGRTSLGDGIVVERRGEEITVHFDTPASRTRRPEKFEALLRATLPRIYGARVDTALAAIPAGALIPESGLITDLPTHGVSVPVSDGATLRVWPETRPGQEGPLVIRYRVVSS
jgi:hypothetical protein